MSFILSKSLYHTGKRFYFLHRYSTVQFQKAAVPDSHSGQQISCILLSSIILFHELYRLLHLRTVSYFTRLLSSPISVSHNLNVLAWINLHNLIFQKIDVFILPHETISPFNFKCLLIFPRIIIDFSMSEFPIFNSSKICYHRDFKERQSTMKSQCRNNVRLKKADVLTSIKIYMIIELNNKSILSTNFASVLLVFCKFEAYNAL